jgi:hypothetical protein
MPIVSLIIPAYNQGHYLAEAIASALAQSVTDLEVVVVDDGSTDDTPTIAQGFADERVRYLRQENQGLAGARNSGLSVATAPLIGFLDSDDALLPDALARHCAALEADGSAGMSVGAVELMDAGGRRIERLSAPPPTITLADLAMGNRFAPHSLLVRRDWLDRAGGFDASLRACEDWDLWLRLVYAGCRIRTMPSQTVARYRVHGAQMTQQSERMRTAAVSTLDKLYALPDLPDDVLAIRPHAYSRIYVDAAARGLRSGDVGQSRVDLDAALAVDPELAEDGGRALADSLAGWAFDHATVDPVAFLSNVLAELPVAGEVCGRRLRSVLADAWWTQALASHRAGDPIAAGSAAWQVVRLEPGRLANRGLRSMVVHGAAGRIRRGARLAA